MKNRTILTIVCALCYLMLFHRLKDGNTWDVEDFGVFPAKLMGLRSSGRVLPT